MPDAEIWRFFDFGRPFVKRFALSYGTVVCLSNVYVTLVYCGQTVGWLRMSIGMEVGLGQGHIVLDWDQLHNMERDRAASRFRKLHPCASPRRLSHHTRKSVDEFDL